MNATSCLKIALATLLASSTSAIQINMLGGGLTVANSCDYINRDAHTFSMPLKGKGSSAPLVSDAVLGWCEPHIFT